MRLANVHGIEVKVNILLVIIFFVGAVMGYIKELAVLFVLVSIHETFHVITAKYYGISVTSIEFMPFGGVARMESISHVEPSTEVIIALAGPWANFMLTLCVLLLEYFGVVPFQKLKFFINANLMLGFFNLYPALPLDGGRILRAVLSTRMGTKAADTICITIGKITGAVLIFLYFYLFFGRITNNPSILLIGFFIFILAGRQQSTTVLMALEDVVRKKKKLARHGAIRVHEIALSQSTPVKKVLDRFGVNRYHIVLVLDSNLNMVGYLSEYEILDLVMQYGLDLSLGKLLLIRNNKK